MAIHSSILTWRNPLAEKPGRPQSTELQKSGHDQSDPVHIDTRFFCVWQLCPCKFWGWRWRSCLACGDSGRARCSGTWTASATGVMALSELFFEPLVAGNQKASLDSLSSELWPFRHLEGSLAWSPSLLFRVSGTWRGPMAGVLLCRLGHQALKGVTWVGSYSVVQCIRHLMGQPLYCLATSAGLWGQRGHGDGSTLRVTQQYRLASMAAWLSSTDISNQNLLPHISLVYLSTVNSSPCPGIAPQSLNSSSQMLCLPGDLCPCLGYVWLQQGLSDSHSI